MACEQVPCCYISISPMETALAHQPAIRCRISTRAGGTASMTKPGLAVDNGRLVVEPHPRPHYTLAELLAASDYSQPQPSEEREWVDAPAAGREETVWL